MMLNEQHYHINYKLRVNELEQQAVRRRLVRFATARWNPHFYDVLLVRLGSSMVNVGMRLQRRYGQEALQKQTRLKRA
jgi:hypothetical protein